MKKSKKPWPTKAAMEQVYAKQLWGSNYAAFYSGEGSHHPAIVAPYIAAVSSFLSFFDSGLTVCDLGCGDFNIGQQLVPFTQKYIGIDIVTALIDYNNISFSSKKLVFECLDISKDILPKADCVLLRQVLQHLSNNEIVGILNKLATYKYVIITEHIPDDDFIPNIDIISGQGTRLKKNSGVDVLKAPFNFEPKEIKELALTASSDGRGVIRTVLYEIF